MFRCSRCSGFGLLWTPPTPRIDGKYSMYICVLYLRPPFLLTHLLGVALSHSRSRLPKTVHSGWCVVGKGGDGVRGRKQRDHVLRRGGSGGVRGGRRWAQGNYPRGLGRKRHLDAPVVVEGVIGPGTSYCRSCARWIALLLYLVCMQFGCYTSTL